MTDDNAATTCARHIPVPSTSATARDHPPRATHGAHQPSGSPGAGSGMPRSSSPRDTVRMPWDTTRPRSARYGREHRAERDRHMRALRAAGAGLCAERVCVKRSRIITPDMALHLCHDPTGQIVIGLGHAECNVHEAATRGNRRQHEQRHRQQRPRRLEW